eukprot:scaffold115234_cov15-Tisochrysis_lutea.AAC.1
MQHRAKKNTVDPWRTLWTLGIAQHRGKEDAAHSVRVDAPQRCDQICHPQRMKCEGFVTDWCDTY